MKNIFVTDVAWPRPADSYAACMCNVKELHKLGILHIYDSADVFNLDDAISRLHLDVHRSGLT